MLYLFQFGFLFGLEGGSKLFLTESRLGPREAVIDSLFEQFIVDLALHVSQVFTQIEADGVAHFILVGLKRPVRCGICTRHRERQGKQAE